MTFSLPFSLNVNYSTEDIFVRQVDLAVSHNLPDEIASFVKEMNIPFKACGFRVYAEDKFLLFVDRKLLSLMRRILFRVYSQQEYEYNVLFEIVADCLTRYVSISTGTYFNELEGKNERITISTESLVDHMSKDENLVQFTQILSLQLKDAKFNPVSAKLFEYGMVVVLIYAIQKVHYFANFMDNNNNKLHANLVRSALKPDSENSSSVFKIPELAIKRKVGLIGSDRVMFETENEISNYITQFYSPFEKFIQIHPSDNKLIETQALGIIKDMKGMKYTSLIFNLSIVGIAWKTGWFVGAIAGFLPLPDSLVDLISSDASRPLAVMLVTYFMGSENPFHVLCWQDTCYEFTSLGQTVCINKPRWTAFSALVVSVLLV